MKRLRNFIFAHRLLSIVLTVVFLIVVLLVLAVLVIAERLAPGLLDFIAALVSSLAWPLAIVVVVLLLRHQIGNLIPLLRRIRYGEFEAEFSEDVVEAAEEVEQRVEETPVEELPAMPEDVKERLQMRIEELRTAAQIDPYLAVMNAWRLVVSEADRAALRNDADRTQRATRIVRTLADRERMPEWVVDAVGELRRLRSEAAYRAAVSPSAALRYIDTAARVVDRLARA
jgi:hypothetical protein